MRFEFATATRIVFGGGTLGGIGPIARELGRRVFVVTGRDAQRARPLLDLLTAAELGVSQFRIEHEPTVDDALRGVACAREAGCDLVVGFGGGSVIDGAKAIAALLTNEGDAYDYVEVVGRARPLTRAPAPFIAIPTTAGTGAEVTRNAVLTATRERVKVSLRSPLMLPRIALVDPELTYDLPPAITAATGLDALTQLIEPYVSSRANPITDPLCIEGIRRVARSLRRAFVEGRDADAREDMAFASLCGGLALANAGLGAVHGLAGPIGGRFPAAHGAVCAALLPHVIAANLAALRTRASDHPALARYAEIARLLTGNAVATADDMVRWTRDLVVDLRIPRLREHGIAIGDFNDLAEGAAKASSMKANPIALTAAELTQILGHAL